MLSFGNTEVNHIREVFTELLPLNVPDDGVRFDQASIAVNLIREDQEYGGVRVEFIARIVSAQIRLQIDVGFGDAITPEARLVEFPPLLDYPAPYLRAYHAKPSLQKNSMRWYNSGLLTAE